MKVFVCLAAITGAFALAVTPPSTVAAPAAFVNYKNDATFKYHCDHGVGVIQCSAAANGCSIIADRVHNCVQSKVGVQFEPMTIEHDIEARFSAPPYKDDSKANYTCAGGSIDRCDIASESCNPYADCNQGCFQLSNGATCIDRQASLTEHLTAEGALYTIEKKDTDAQLKKSYKCSDQHNSVLVCQFGFCSLDHYCTGKKSRCFDGCACCRNPRVALLSRDEDTSAMTEMHTMEFKYDARTINAEARDATSMLPADDTLVADNLNPQPQAPTSFATIGQDTSDKPSTILLPAYIPSAVKHADVQPALPTFNYEPDVPGQIGTSNYCPPGAFGCYLDRYVFTCDYAGRSVYSADCGPSRCVASVHNTAYCAASAVTKASGTTIAAKGQTADTVTIDSKHTRDLDTAAESANCFPGRYRCMNGLIQRCNKELEQNPYWRNIVDCYPYKRCVEDPNRTVYCLPITTKTPTAVGQGQTENMYWNGPFEGATPLAPAAQGSAATTKI
ncbi:hypothetical protein ACN47E_005863 [Coniothyrium glycines]